MFERLKLTKRLEEHEDRLSTAERRLNALTMEWADTLDRMKRMMGRLSKDRQRIEEIQPTPDETLGESETATTPSLSQRQQLVNARILARRNRAQ